MRLLVAILGCSALALVTSMTFFKEPILLPVNTAAPESTTELTSATFSPLPEAEPLVKATQALPQENFIREFAIPYTFTIGETFTYSDGLAVTLKSINDSRCSKEVACVTVGILVAAFTITSATSSDSTNITLDSAHTATIKTNTYEYTLVNSTETEATIIIRQRRTTTTEETASAPKTSLTTVPTALQTVAVSKTQTLPSPKINPSAMPKNTETPMSEFKKALVAEIEKQTNEYRRNHKRAPLVTDSDLAKNATLYSTHLLRNTFLSHTDLQGCDITCRFADNSYNAQAWGENLALLSFNEQPSVEYVANFFMTQWEKSASHRENLLSKTFTNQGIGVAFDQNKIYVVVQFANPS